MILPFPFSLAHPRNAGHGREGGQQVNRAGDFAPAGSWRVKGHVAEEGVLLVALDELEGAPAPASESMFGVLKLGLPLTL